MAAHTLAIRQPNWYLYDPVPAWEGHQHSLIKINYGECVKVFGVR